MLFTNVPLAGIRVITLALNVPGPMAAERLRDLGASITKVEPPDGDPLKSLNPRWYSRLTNGVTVVTCNLKSALGSWFLSDKLANTDLLLTSQRPAALKRIGNDVILAGQAGVAGHCVIGDGAVITAQSGTHGDIPPGAVMSGSPAIDNKLWLRCIAAYNRLPEMARALRHLAPEREKKK